MQKNWIGRSEGTEVDFTFEYKGENIKIPVFTTRIDTIYGVTYICLAPEHDLVSNIILKEKPELKEEIDAMINEDKISREAQDKEKNGIFTGFYVKNPINSEMIPMYIANYVLMDYGTGAVMAVPAHDDRDFKFAQKYNLRAKAVIKAKNPEFEFDGTKAYLGKGTLINSGEFDGLSNVDSKDAIVKKLESLGEGKKTINYRLHDWLISRQRYWGTPIPVIYGEDGNLYLDENLPVELPIDVSFDTGGNPLETSQSFKEVTLPNGVKGIRETDTMDTFVDSSWYYLRYLNPKGEDLAFDKLSADKNTPVDQYIGGIEHAVMHLLYARFFHKVFRDLGYLDTNEPFKNLLTQGMVLDYSYYSNNERRYLFREEVEIKDGNPVSKKTGEILVSKLEKMSKSKNNGFINRIYLLVQENREILNKKYSETIVEHRNKYDESLQRKTHLTIKKVTESMEDNFHFNTAIAAIMELLNELTTFKQNVLDLNEKSSESDKIFKESMEAIILMISPFSPHVSEELWREMGEEGYIFNAKWPVFIEKLTISNEVTIAVQVNGKLRGTLVSKLDSTEDEVFGQAINISNVAQFIEGKEIVKKILVKNKLLNIVVK